MSADEEVLNANQERIATAIKSIGLANALTWFAVAQLLDEKGVCTREQFAETAMKVADVMGGLGPTVGAEMLTIVHDYLKGINPPPAAPAWTPSIVPGGLDPLCNVR